MKILEVNNLYFSYQSEKLILEDLNFSINKGDYVCLIGSNGSGKSTIAKLIIGLLNIDKGNIIVDGLVVNPDNISEIRDKVGIVFQNPDNQFIGATVEDDIAFGLENHQVASEEMPSLIRKYVTLVGMQDFLKSEPSKLSGGQKQKVAIAGALATNPDLLIFDEASAMLDPQGKKEIIQLAKQLNKENAKTILSITHDMEEVVYSDYVLVLDKGKILISGTPNEVFTQVQYLLSAHMDLPFVAKLSLALKKAGLAVSGNLFEQDLVEELWQLNSKN